MITPIQYILSELGKIHNETAILEACDWDEENVETLFSNLETLVFDTSISLTENLETFCKDQTYISEYNREQLYGVLEQVIIFEIKEFDKPKKEYEN